MKPCPMWRLAFALSIGLCLLACQPLATTACACRYRLGISHRLRATHHRRALEPRHRHAQALAGWDARRSLTLAHPPGYRAGGRMAQLWRPE